MAFTRTL